MGPTEDNELAARELARLGLESLSEGKVGEARLRFCHALRKCKTNPQARHHLANLMWDQGHRQEAIEQMQQALEHAPQNPEWHVQLGRMMLEEQDSVAALAEAQKATNLAPDSGATWRLLADIQREENEHDAAKLAYHRCLTCNTLEPADEEAALINLAELSRLEGKPLRSLALLQRLEDTTTRPRPDIAYEQAVALHAMARYADALKKFGVASETRGDDEEMLLMWADCHFRAGNHTAAQEMCDRLLASSSSKGDPRLDALRAQLDAVSGQLASQL